MRGNISSNIPERASSEARYTRGGVTREMNDCGSRILQAAYSQTRRITTHFSSTTIIKQTATVKVMVKLYVYGIMCVVRCVM